MKPVRKKVNRILKSLHESSAKGIAWLIDPDKVKDLNVLKQNFFWVKDSGLDLIFVGGSSLTQDNFRELIRAIRNFSGSIPIVIFPGSQMQLAQEADAILFLSLISGRNPEYLIGQQVAAAPTVEQMELEVLPTAYLLINETEVTSVQYISQTTPIPNSKPNLARATALAGKFMGMRYVFLDAGSGAKNPVSESVIATVRQAVNLPLIVGGGIDELGKLKKAFQSGADLVVLGNAIEQNPDFLIEALAFKTGLNLALNVN